MSANGTNLSALTRQVRFLSMVGILGFMLLNIGHAQDGWQISLTAEQSGLLDKATIVCSATTGSAKGYDYNDILVPPSFPDRSLDLYMEHSSTETGWERQPAATLHYCSVSTCPLNHEPQTFDFVLQTSVAGSVFLNWDPVSDPDLDGYQVVMEDTMLGARLDMSQYSQYQAFFYYPGTRQFRIEIQQEDTPTPTETTTVTSTPTATETPTSTPTPTVTPTTTETPTVTQTPTPRLALLRFY